MVGACRYPPAGRRGSALGSARASDYGINAPKYKRAAADELLIVCQIESPKAVENVQAIPLLVAEKCFAAVGSKHKTLKVFSREEGGFHHCQVDNVTIGTNFMWDWAADVLKPGT